MRVPGLLLAAALLGAGARSPDVPADVADDGVPPGMVSFFTTSACPAGWNAADLAAGRLVIAVTDPVAVGRGVGTPLGPAEDRTHGHTIAATLALPPKSISAADGGNNSGGASGDRALSGAAATATSGLPFAQLVVCVRPL